MRDGWLLLDERVICSAEVTESRSERQTGLLGRDGLAGAMVFERTRRVHTRGMTFAIDVAFLDDDGVVRAIETLPPGKRSRRHRGCRMVVEASAGAFAAWGVAVGDRLTVRR